MNIEASVLVIGLFFLKFVFGIWLKRSGKPYNVVILTVHKIIALLTVTFIAITVRRLGQDVDISAAEMGAIIVSGFLFLCAILSGGVLSTDKPAQAAILITHKVTSVLAVLSTAVTIYLLA